MFTWTRWSCQYSSIDPAKCSFSYTIPTFVLVRLSGGIFGLSGPPLFENYVCDEFEGVLKENILTMGS